MGSLGDKLNYLLDTKSAIKNALTEKGVSVSDSDTFRSYADKISSISSGSSGSGSTAYIERVLNNGKLEMPSGSIELSSEVKDLGSYALHNAYVYSDVESVSFPALTTVSGSNALYRAFYGCGSLTSISFPALTTISGSSALYSAFDGCGSLTSISFPALTTISGSSALYSAFYDCYSLTSISFPALTTVSGSNALGDAFDGCGSLTSISFPALTSTSFGSYTNQFNDVLRRVAGCTVHFPSNLESVIGSWSDVTSGFGGENTTVLFDLPETT